MAVVGTLFALKPEFLEATTSVSYSRKSTAPETVIEADLPTQGTATEGDARLAEAALASPSVLQE